jgi:hypothetical protein
MIRVDEFPAEPSRDTAPLELDQLSDSQLDVILAVEQRLYEAQQTPPLNTGTALKTRYLAQAEQRYARVLLLDGERGAGKTSLLLTLLNRWQSTEYRDRLHADPTYRARVAAIEAAGDLTPRGFEIPSFVRVVANLDFDPIPPGLPLIAGLVQAWQLIALHYDRLSIDASDEDEDTLSDSWHELFTMAAVGWDEIPRNRGLVEQAMDRKDQVQNWQQFESYWRDFIDKLIGVGRHLKLPDRLDAEPVFVVIIDDVDLQVTRIRHLLPTLRLLRHGRVLFLVAADQAHMLDMLKLDFAGQQHHLIGGGQGTDVDIDKWARELAWATFEKAFPLRNRWHLRPLYLLDVLSFHDRMGNSFHTLLNNWVRQSLTNPSQPPSLLTRLDTALESAHPTGLGDYLSRLATDSTGICDLPPLSTYRTLHQIGQQVLQHNTRANAAEAVCQLLLPRGGREIARNIRRATESTIEYDLSGQMTAVGLPELVEPLNDRSDIVLSSRPDFLFRNSGAEVNLRMSETRQSTVNFTAALCAISLREDNFGLAGC